MNKEVDQYIGKQGPKQQKVLKKIRRLLKKIAPESIETMSYGVPAFKLGDACLLMYASFKNHLGIYPEPAAIKFFAKELKVYETSKGTIKFSLDQELPYALLEKIVKYKYKKLMNKSKK